jgi:hypothetical protein
MGAGHPSLEPGQVGSRSGIPEAVLIVPFKGFLPIAETRVGVDGVVLLFVRYGKPYAVTFAWSHSPKILRE